MKFRKTIFVSILAIGLLMLSATQSGVIAQSPPDNPGAPQGDNFEVDTGEVTVKVTGGQNVPKYTFWDSDDNTTMYRVQFKQVFEFYDDNSNGVYDVAQNESRVAGQPYALASLSWNFSDVVEDTDGTHFNISSDNGLFTFANHIADGANSMKFDVIIDESYEFTDENASLALAFSLDNMNSDDSEATQEDNLVSFDGAFFEVEETAQDDNGDINVGLSSSTGTNESVAYIAYEQFTGELVHDPTVGVQASAVDDSDDTNGNDNEGPALASDEVEILWDFDISKGAASMSSLIATFIAVLVPVTLYRARKD